MRAEGHGVFFFFFSFFFFFFHFNERPCVDRSYEYSRDFHQSNREQKWGWFLYWHGVGLTELKAGHEIEREVGLCKNGSPASFWSRDPPWHSSLTMGHSQQYSWGRSRNRKQTGNSIDLRSFLVRWSTTGHEMDSVPYSLWNVVLRLAGYWLTTP